MPISRADGDTCPCSLADGSAGAGPVFTGLPDVRLGLRNTTVLEDRLMLLDCGVGEG